MVTLGRQMVRQMVRDGYDGRGVSGGGVRGGGRVAG